MEKSEKEWERQRYEANQALGRIESRRRVEQAKSVMGKCYRYRNSHGGDRPKWWLYARVVAARDGWPVLFMFETMQNGEIRVQSGNVHLGTPDSHGYEPITEAEYMKAWRALQKVIARTRPAPAKRPAK